MCAARAPPVVDTFSLRDALPIWTGVVEVRHRLAVRTDRVEPVLLVAVASARHAGQRLGRTRRPREELARRDPLDRKSTRLNSSHVEISYAVFCLKKKRSDIEQGV